MAATSTLQSRRERIESARSVLTAQPRGVHRHTIHELADLSRGADDVPSCIMTRRGRPATHDFAETNTASRGWRAFARHDVERSALAPVPARSLGPVAPVPARSPDTMMAGAGRLSAPLSRPTLRNVDGRPSVTMTRRTWRATPAHAVVSVRTLSGGGATGEIPDPSHQPLRLRQPG